MLTSGGMMAACEMTMLVVAFLSVESSYIQEIERPATEVPDTVQFWLGTEGNYWRIKTFAIDHDIHIYRIGDGSQPNSFSVERAKVNIQKSYGDVLERLEVLCIPDPSAANEIAEMLRETGIPGSVEVSEAGFGFLRPDDGSYRTQSRPK